jgi:hypothetical protein
MKKIFLFFLFLYSLESALDLKNVKNIIFNSLSFNKNQDNTNALNLLKNIKEQSEALGYNSMFFHINGDIFNPTNLGFATEGFFYALFLYWLTNFFLKDTKAQDGFLDLMVPYTSFPWIKQNGTSNMRHTGGYYYRPFTEKLHGEIEISRPDQIILLKESINNIYLNKFKFYSTVFLHGAYDDETSHYFMIGIDFKDKIIFVIDPLGGKSNNVEKSFAEKLKFVLGENFKSFKTIGLRSEMQEQEVSCGMVASFMAFIFALGGPVLLKKTFSLYNKGFNNQEDILSFSDITIKKLDHFKEDYINSTLIFNNKSFRETMELSLGKTIFEFLLSVKSFDLENIFSLNKKTSENEIIPKTQIKNIPPISQKSIIKNPEPNPIHISNNNVPPSVNSLSKNNKNNDIDEKNIFNDIKKNKISNSNYKKNNKFTEKISSSWQFLKNWFLKINHNLKEIF